MICDYFMDMKRIYSPVRIANTHLNVCTEMWIYDCSLFFLLLSARPIRCRLLIYSSHTSHSTSKICTSISLFVQCDSRGLVDHLSESGDCCLLALIWVTGPQIPRLKSKITTWIKKVCWLTNENGYRDYYKFQALVNK